MRKLITTLLCASIFPAVAQPAPKPLWELGVGVLGVSQQAYPGSNYQRQAALVLPMGVYRGDIVRADGNGLHVKAFSVPGWELDVGAAAALGSKASQVPVRQGMQDIGTLVEFGPRLKWFMNPRTKTEWRLELPLRGVFNVNRGFKDEGLSFEPQLVFESPRSSAWHWQASAGALFGDKRLNHMFYGVDDAYVTSQRSAYNAGGGLVAWRLKSSLSYELSRDLRLFGFAQFNTVSGASNAHSPLVNQNAGATYGVGITYTFAKSTQMGKL